MINVLEKKEMICGNLSVSPEGHLTFAGQDTLELAARYGTPLYLMDERRIRERCRTYLDAAAEAFRGNAKICYASKAASFKRVYEIMKEEGMCIDVVSSGEICTAVKAGFPMENAYFHSNNKTDEDISYAMDCGVGCFVADNREELFAVEREAARRGVVQNVMLRLTPGIDPHTYAAVSTGQVDSKFGAAIETGQAEDLTEIALSLHNVKLIGFHCHVGSQVFDSDVYLRASDVMLRFIADMRDKLDYVPAMLDLGGGYGVRYVREQPTIDIAANIREVAAHMRATAEQLGVSLPTVCFEPGRSIVADAGLTLYTAGTVKEIHGFKTYVSVDGGMTDNARYALYKAPYTLYNAGKMNEPADMVCSVVGRCCESGDIIQENVRLPGCTGRGSVIACLTTGAYHYSMASNYNRIPRPPVVMLNGGDSYVAVRRETLEDLVALDV